MDLKTLKIEAEKEVKKAKNLKELEEQKSLEDYDEAVKPILRKELIMENDIIEQLARNEIISEGEGKNVIMDNEFKELLDKFIEYSKKQ